MSAFQLNTPHTRRRFLRNAGVVIALPLMESLLPRAMAKDAAKKPVKRFVALSNNYGVYPQAFFPALGGREFELPATLKPLEPHRADFTVFSNLDHGLQGGHACVPSLLSGVMPVVAPNFPEMNMSLDQKLAEHVGAATRFSSMTLAVMTRISSASRARVCRCRRWIYGPCIARCSWTTMRRTRLRRMRASHGTGAFSMS